MKKYLLLLIPIALWILCYFVWGYSDQFIAHDNGQSAWWVFTDLALGILAVISLIACMLEIADR